MIEFIAFVAQYAAGYDPIFRHHIVYEDKSLFTARGPVWHKSDREKNEIPQGLWNVDKTAVWSKSGYHGWVHGYGLHLTNIQCGFPVMCVIEAANVNERKVLDQKKTHLVALGIHQIIADAGYICKQRTEELAKSGLFLITPKTTIGQVRTLSNLHLSLTDAQLDEMKASRKTAIEPIFDLLSKLLATTGEHKPLPIRGMAQVSTFLSLGVLILQLTMLMNKMYGLPLRNVTHIKYEL